MQADGLSKDRISQAATYAGSEIENTDDKGIYRKIFIGESELEPGHYIIKVESKWPDETENHVERMGLTKPALLMLYDVMLKFGIECGPFTEWKNYQLEVKVETKQSCKHGTPFRYACEECDAEDKDDNQG